MDFKQELVIMLNKESTEMPKHASEVAMFASHFGKFERVHFIVGEQLDPVDFRRYAPIELHQMGNNTLL